MPYEKLQLAGAHSEVLSWANHAFSLEEQNMLRNVSRLPCLFKHVALMPDAHLGKGSMVGSVVATKEAVIPATVGVDIGCGMMAVKTPFKSGILDGKLKDLRLKIEEAIQPDSVNTRSRLTSPRTGKAGTSSKNFTMFCAFCGSPKKVFRFSKEAGPNSMLRSCYIFS